MNRLFLNTKTAAVVLAVVLVISSFLTSCRKISSDMSSEVENDYVSQHETVNSTENDESQSNASSGSSMVQQNSSQSQVSSGITSSNEEVVTKPSAPNDNTDVLPDSSFWSDNTDPEGIMLSSKNTFIINTANTGKTLSSFFNNINVWGVYAPSKDSKYDIYEFVDYVQLMQCSGGSGNRDLFKNPADSSVLDDYDFTRLINACRGILNLGAKPNLKLGGVPIKFTKNYQNGYYNMNANPPDDYNVYYNYIYALADALVKEFGRQEVLSWRFGVMTEYENKQWFVAKSGDANDTKIAYFKLYDYTVQALIDAIGEDVFVGAHSMTCTEGMWDEAEFIEHVAKGTNYATGKIGTKISYLSASYYHQVAGTMTGKRQKTFVQTMSYLQDAARKYGLNNLEFGVDEGRMLMGINSGRNSYDLNNRVVGYSYQGAFDAKLYKDAVDNDIDYFSSWGFLGSTNMPTVSYYVAKNTSKFDGLKQLETVKKTTSSKEADIQAISAYDPATKTLRIMAYNFKNDYNYSKKASLSFTIAAPIQSGKVSIIKEYVNDDCNYFDEWLNDRKTYNITDNMFSWSPDDPGIEAFLSNASEELKNTYYKKLKPNYLKASVLNPKVEYANVSGGELTLNDTIDGNSVVFYEIKF